MAEQSYDLVILAAGMGSRFGGLKQVQPVGPHDEMIIEYSVFDAMRAGFDRLVLVIRKDIEADFRATIGRRLEARIDVQYVHQEIDSLPAGFKAPAGRTKPWGTGHAVLVACDAVRRPFAAINADDFYGAGAYRALVTHFAQTEHCAMVGYPLRQTLSEHGTVSRGLCATDPAGRLQTITEITNIEKRGTGASHTDAQGTLFALTGDEIVSMNFWGLTPAVFPQLEKMFSDFLHRAQSDLKAEFYLPTTLSELNERRETSIDLLESDDAWFGITYRDDLPTAQTAIKKLIGAGRYPAPLWVDG